MLCDFYKNNIQMVSEADEKISIELKFHTGIKKFLGQIQALKKLAKYDTNHGV